jgi:hypothetical protein
MYNIKKRPSFINYTRVGVWETLLHKGWASNDKRSARSEAGKLLPCKGNRESRIKLINNSLFKYRFYLSIITCIKHVFYQKHKHDQDRAGLILIIKMNYKFKFRVMTFFCQSDCCYWTRDFSFKLQPFYSLGSTIFIGQQRWWHMVTHI